MTFDNSFFHQHLRLSRRYLMSLGATGVTAAVRSPAFAMERDEADPNTPRELDDAVEALEPWLTPPDEFQDVSRGKPKPHSLDEKRRKEVGLTRDSWELQVIADPDNPADLGSPMSTENGNAFDFDQLMDLAKTKAVRFPKIMTCLNIGCPLGNGIWEGVPMRDVIWQADPSKDLRRVIYYGYHNDDEKQMFRSSLPVGRVLEDYFGLPPVILCYKLNGEFLSPERGGPVRVVVPEAYGFKSIKWLSHLLLSNLASANDTYAEKNNDVHSPLKTFCEILSIDRDIKPRQPIPITGYAQVGISGLSKVQVWVEKKGSTTSENDPHFELAPWKDAQILSLPQGWDASLGDDSIDSRPIDGFDQKTLRPENWPLRLSKVHWAILHPGLDAGEYNVRCRTIDGNGVGQPMPRPFRKSGRAFIQRLNLRVRDQA